jgi:hypothetical protein
MISRQELKPTSTMSRDRSGTSKLGDACAASQSPQSCITKANDKIRVSLKYLLAETVQLRFELATDVLGGEESWVSVDTGRFGSTEILKLVAGWVYIKHIGTVYSSVSAPNLVNLLWVSSSIVIGYVFPVGGCKSQNICFIEHPQ